MDNEILVAIITGDYYNQCSSFRNYFGNFPEKSPEGGGIIAVYKAEEREENDN